MGYRRGGAPHNLELGAGVVTILYLLDRRQRRRVSGLTPAPPGHPGSKNLNVCATHRAESTALPCILAPPRACLI